ncbi:CBS domain-containing protein [Roseospira navarrensis]|uniref:CBS domain-containing protein n=1 Tax=Roseospira navarrensis TaxID=140058 RepID=A0A7X2D462_9PROT|nr:CBS domain-containing protein [Roseospira navarrensis]MQX35860.1 CBS domain-containing protein [Roseospira navarrensis]
MPTDDTRTEPTTLMRYQIGDMTPSELIAREELSRRDKLAVLRQWEHDALELLVAEEENMGGGPSPPLSEIRDAMRALNTDRDPDRPDTTAGAVMTQGVRTVHSDNRIADAARQMRAENVGMLIVLDGDRVVGTVTDRDIAVRCVGKDLDARAHAVSDIMTNRVVACPTQHTIREAADLMAREGLRRLCVVDEHGGLAGVLSLADLALGVDGDATVGRVLRAITRAPASGDTPADQATSRHSESSHPGGLHVYNMKPAVGG